MPRCWVIAPVGSKPSELFDKVWQFDVANNLISIGWSELGDISMMSWETLSDAVAVAYPNNAKGHIVNTLWAFYHDIVPGDFVIARRGRKILAAVGKVVRSGFYAPGRNPFLASPDYSHSNFLEVEWQQQPRDKVFPSIVFPMQTLTKVEEVQYRKLLEAPGAPSETSEGTETSEEGAEASEDPNAFALEKHLEDFIVENFDTIFKGKLKMYGNTEVANGRQYATEIGLIDILAVEPKSNSFVVIELKKGRPSDPVVGQILRYMGWVKQNLCKDGQTVKGLVICPEHEPDTKLSYALEMTNNINVRYYSVSFKLSEAS